MRDISDVQVSLDFHEIKGVNLYYTSVCCSYLSRSPLRQTLPVTAYETKMGRDYALLLLVQFVGISTLLRL